jgi:hypothetical protein
MAAVNGVSEPISLDQKKVYSRQFYACAADCPLPSPTKAAPHLVQVGHLKGL